MTDNTYSPRIPDADPREAKLPVWAQQMIADYRRITTDAVTFAQAAQLKTNPNGSSILLDPHSGSEAAIGLDDPAIGRAWRREIGFRVPAKGYPNGGLICVQLLRDGDGIEVRGDSALSIEPWVTNTIRVKHTERG